MKRQVNDMKRFNTCTKHGIQYVENLNKSTVVMSIADFRSIEAKLNTLDSYIDTGRTPEEIINLCDANSNLLKYAISKMVIKNERDQWKRQAITYANQLGILRIWHSKYGPAIDEILEEDFKTMFPDTKCSMPDSN
jgi:hypothetical protein